MRRWIAFISIALAAVALSAAPAAACAVCYGESDSPIARGVDLSILFMAVLVYGLIVGGGVVLFVHMARARRAVEQGREGERATSSWAS